jgi:uncharacterized membrane protein YhaH (DUF805 family)
MMAQVEGRELPLWAPVPHATFLVAFRRFWKKYVVFTGRASRSEFWWWALFDAIVLVILEIVFNAVVGSSTVTRVAHEETTHPLVVHTGPAYFVIVVLMWAWFLLTLLPGLALSVRRLHDVNISAWYLLIVLVPFIGGIALLVVLALRSRPAGVRFDRASAQVPGPRTRSVTPNQ